METMSERAKASRAEYYRKWRAMNPEKVKEKNRRYWERRAAKNAAEKEAEKNAEDEND